MYETQLLIEILFSYYIQRRIDFVRTASFEWLHFLHITYIQAMQ